MVLSWIVALIGLYLMVRSPRPVAVGMFVLPLVLGLVDRRGLVRAARVGLARVGRHDRVLGDGARDLPAGRRGLHLRGVLRRADVPGPDAAAQGQAAVPDSAWRCRASSNPSGSTAGPSRSPSRCLTFGLLIGMVLSLAARGEGPAAVVHRCVDRSQGLERAGDVAGLRGPAARAVPAGDAGPERDGADDRGLCLPGLHLGRRRGAAAAHGPWRGHGDAPGG